MKYMGTLSTYSLELVVYLICSVFWATETRETAVNHL